jgi:hypothetical protein
MGGGLMQLIAYGEQDIYLTKNPQITYFKIVYRRYTNYASQLLTHTFGGVPNFGEKGSAIIPKEGDLLHRMYLYVKIASVDPTESQDISAKFSWVRRLGHALIESINIVIGGTVVDTQYGEWLDIWWELTRETINNVRGYLKMIGDDEILTEYNNLTKPEYDLFIPLQFWFNRNSGLSIPLIALQYHDVVMNIQFRKSNQVIIANNDFIKNNIDQISIIDSYILSDVIFLDTEERRRFAKDGHEYLIEQIQYNGEELVKEGNLKYRLDFNHPTKEIYWCMKNGNYTNGHKFIAYTHLSGESNWNISAKDATLTLLKQSHIFSLDEIIPVSPGSNWQQINPQTTLTINNWTIDNKSSDVIVYYNSNSLLGSNNVSITARIKGIMTLNSGDIIENLENNIFYDIFEYLRIRDISVPTDCCVDTRSQTLFDLVIIPGIGNDPDIVNITQGSLSIPEDIIVYQWDNCGILIDKSGNPIQKGLIQLNGHDRFDVREGIYFNKVVSEIHHTNIAVDGINSYSFALNPEKHQPSGTSNLSRIDQTDLILWFEDNTFTSGDVDIGFFNNENRILIYSLSYNILRIMSGLAALAYQL